jgi:hypothetical protein
VKPSPTSPKLGDPDPDAWVLVLHGTEGTPPVAVRMRKLLKHAARLGLKCVSAATVDTRCDGCKARQEEPNTTALRRGEP